MNKSLESEKEILDALYKGLDISKMSIPKSFHEEYNHWKEFLELPDLSDDPVYTLQWFMPEEYSKLDLTEYLGKRCRTQKEKNRVYEELTLFELAGQLDLVKYLIYLVDFMKQRNVVWGVGRGSSVSIYIFYLIGIHKVDSLKYDLDYAYFFKIGETDEVI
jgi:DNA polymerase III alpha subunit